MAIRVPRQFPHAICAGLIVVLACALYLPFLGNPPIFDDVVLFSGYRFSYYATHPFGLELRVPPYFSFAIAQVLSGRMEVHRVLSLVLHIACALAVYKLLYGLLALARRPDPLNPISGPQSDAAAYAFIGAALFAIHPVAVYGAGYLVQRTIVLATLFSLLSIILLVRGLHRGSHADAISAALMYAVAVLCKEHSVLLPAVAALAVPLVRPERRFALRHVAIYLSACVPAAVFVVLLSRGIIGGTYEPEFEAVTAQIEGDVGRDIADFPRSLSVVTQAGLFFKYLALWLWPDTRAMSIDLRFDFSEGLSPAWILLKVSAFAAFGALGFLLWRRGKWQLVGFGLLFTWVLFLVEFSAARFQEPFVLYRSYLWAPGILLAVTALLSRVPRRAALIAFAFVCPVLLYQAHDRLVTLSSPLALWKDAIAKLPDKPVPWGSRVLYNLARAYSYDGQQDKAIDIAERCLAQYPNTYDCYFARGVIHLQMEEYEQAMPYLMRAVALQPGSGIAHHRLGVVLENLGRLEEAKAFYRRASDIGFKGADHEISRLESPGSGLLPPKKTTSTAR